MKKLPRSESVFALCKYYEYSNCLNLFLKLKQELLDEVVPDPFMFEDVDEFVEHAKGYAEGMQAHFIKELEFITEEIMEANEEGEDASNLIDESSANIMRIELLNMLDFKTYIVEQKKKCGLQRWRVKHND